MLYPELEYATRLRTLVYVVIHYLALRYTSRPVNSKDVFPDIGTKSIASICIWMHSDQTPSFPTVNQWANTAFKHFKRNIMPKNYFDYPYKGERRSFLIEMMVRLYLHSLSNFFRLSRLIRPLRITCGHNSGAMNAT